MWHKEQRSAGWREAKCWTATGDHSNSTPPSSRHHEASTSTTAAVSARLDTSCCPPGSLSYRQASDDFSGPRWRTRVGPRGTNTNTWAEPPTEVRAKPWRGQWGPTAALLQASRNSLLCSVSRRNAHLFSTLAGPTRDQATRLKINLRRYQSSEVSRWNLSESEHWNAEIIQQLELCGLSFIVTEMLQIIMIIIDLLAHGSYFKTFSAFLILTHFPNVLLWKSLHTFWVYSWLEGKSFLTLFSREEEKNSLRNTLEKYPKTKDCWLTGPEELVKQIPQINHLPKINKISNFPH